jgi:hypothetical protein
MQVSYNVTGYDLAPNNVTTRKRVTTALRKALGKSVNATLLGLAGSAAGEGTPDATPAPDATTGDGGSAGAPESAAPAAAPDSGRAGKESSQCLVL